MCSDLVKFKQAAWKLNQKHPFNGMHKKKSKTKIKLLIFSSSTISPSQCEPITNVSLFHLIWRAQAELGWTTLTTLHHTLTPPGGHIREPQAQHDMQLQPSHTGHTRDGWGLQQPGWTEPWASPWGGNDPTWRERSRMACWRSRGCDLVQCLSA